jgi:hypothetical protein
MDTISHDIDETFEQFDERIGLGRKSYLRRPTREILGVSDSGLDRLIRQGAIRPFVVGQQQQSFWGPDITKLMWRRRAPVPTAAPPESKYVKRTPPKTRHHQGRKGRPRTSPIARVRA